MVSKDAVKKSQNVITVFEYSTVFTQDECDSIVDRLNHLPADAFKQHIRSRILGTNLYEYTNFRDYIEPSKKNNKVLEQNFKWMYVKLQARLSEELGIEVRYNDKLSLPGFQMYSYDEKHEVAPASIWHYDDEKMGFPVRPVDRDLTFTILIENPGKSTYNYFPCTGSLYTKENHAFCKDHVHLKCNQTCANPNCELTDDKMKTVEYEVGSMLLTYDRYLHRIGPTEFHDKNKTRITLQGHGYIKDNVLYLHW
jgi:hypothetical protein